MILHTHGFHEYDNPLIDSEPIQLSLATLHIIIYHIHTPHLHELGDEGPEPGSQYRRLCEGASRAHTPPHHSIPFTPHTLMSLVMTVRNRGPSTAGSVREQHAEMAAAVGPLASGD